MLPTIWCTRSCCPCFSGLAAGAALRDLRERGKGKGKPKKNAGIEVLAAGQEVSVVLVVKDNNGKKETERLVVRIRG